MEFDYRKLRGKIKEVFGTQNSLALAMGMGRTSLSQRLAGNVQFTPIEIERVCALLHIPGRELPNYFFAQEVQKQERNMD